jgi:serine/threonine protein kinase
MSNGGRGPEEVQAIFNSICSDASQAVVYEGAALHVITIIRSSYASSFEAQFASQPTPAQSALLPAITAAVRALHETVRSITRDEWPHVACDWPIDKVPRDLKTRMDELAVLLERLGGQPLARYGPTQDEMAQDLQTIYLFFKNMVDRESEGPAVQERLESARRLMRHNGVSIPQSEGTAAMKELLAEFKNMREFQLSHSDFVNDGTKLGTGASGSVFLGVQKSTGRKVAIKVLNQVEADEYQANALRREIAALSSLRNPFLVEFIGATTTRPYWIVTEYMTGKSMWTRLRSEPRLNGSQLTAIAYEVAVAMAYLHSKNVIHRDLKTLNVLLDDDNRPRLCDFGIARRLDERAPLTERMGTYNYMAPEVIEGAQYGLKADVFSYGLMLWEMATAELPYRDCENPWQIRSAILRNERPPRPDDASEQLWKLIDDCWQRNPRSRPAFLEILQRMTKWQIAFPGAAADLIEQFYDGQNPSAPFENDADLVLRLVQNPTEELNPTLQRINNSAEEVAKLRGTAFISKAVPLLEKLQYPATLAYTLVCVLKTRSSVVEFFNAGGLPAILHMLQSNSSETTKYAVSLLHTCRYHLNPADEDRLVARLLSIQQWAVALELAETSTVDLEERLQAHLPLIVKNMDDSPACATLLSKVTPKMALQLTKRDQIARLVQADSFRAKLTPSFLTTLTTLITDPSGSQVAKQAALELLLGYPKSEIERFGRSPAFVAEAMRSDPQATILFFFTRTDPSIVMANVDLLEPAGSSPAVLRLLVELAQTHSRELSQLKWLSRVLFASLNGRDFIEMPLRLVHTLSKEVDLAGQLDLVERLLQLLGSGECSVVERTLILRACLTVAHLSLIAHYRQFLLAAESMLEYAPIALRVLARQNLPAPQTRYADRLLAIANAFLDASDPDGHLAAMEIVIKMARRDGYLAEPRGVEAKVGAIAQQTADLEVFRGALRVFRSLRVKPPFDVRAVGQRLIADAEDPELVASVRKMIDSAPRSRAS